MYLVVGPLVHHPAFYTHSGGVGVAGQLIFVSKMNLCPICYRISLLIFFF